MNDGKIGCYKKKSIVNQALYRVQIIFSLIYMRPDYLPQTSIFPFLDPCSP